MDDIARIGQLEVLTSDGERRPLGEFWRGQTTVVALVRHFG